ncbi:MAG: gliding motility-associated ABC transporter substrate-binding protein GldG [Paludibacteraceae bacterium]|nr:gliding motility-associated ABC transporter substrate-binding protein GldG [Paludibacteraceae bacterium]
MNKRKGYIVGITCMVLLGVAAYLYPLRWDLTEDKRYSLGQPTKELLGGLDSPVQIEVLLDGDLNSGFRRLRRATVELIDEMSRYGRVHMTDVQEGSTEGLQPTVIHEREQNGKTAQTTVYPYAKIHYRGRQTVVTLLKNNRALTGEQNLNKSIENLEYVFAEAIHCISRDTIARIAFLEGHGELDEADVYDVSRQLSRYFDVDRGALTDDVQALAPYKVVIVASPQTPLSERDKYILDQYVMHGGRVLWALDGVRLSEDMLSESGMTPVIPLELNLTDMLFRYGVRINSTLVQDLQCMTIPVDVSGEAGQPQYQPMPWTYAPLLLTASGSPVTKDVMQVSSVFTSTIDTVGGSADIRKEVLLATSTASRQTHAPAEIDLNKIQVDPQYFVSAYLPVAVRLEGEFPSVFSHRMIPEGLTDNDRLDRSVHTRQLVVASGSVLLNHWQQGQPLPVGYDRYTGIQFGNRDFVVNAVLDLADDSGLIGLREKTISLRLLNDRRAHQSRALIQTISVLIPLLLIGLLAISVLIIRRRKYILS